MILNLRVRFLKHTEGPYHEEEDENVIVKALKFEVSGSRGRPKQTWKKQVENEMKKNGLVKEDACDRTKWRGVVKLHQRPATSTWWCSPLPNGDRSKWQDRSPKGLDRKVALIVLDCFFAGLLVDRSQLGGFSSSY